MKYKQIDGNRQNLQKAWTLKDGSQTGNFDLLPESVHNAEGWFQCIDDPAISTPETHKLGVDALVDGRWQRLVVEKTADEIADDTATTSTSNIKLLDIACREHIDKSSHWTAGPMIWDKAAGGKPKSKAIKDWTEECWTQYFTNKAMLSSGALFNESMIVYPVCPYDIGEAFQE